MRYEDENIWLTKKMMATLYDVTVPAINQHLKHIFTDNELIREATVKKYLIVQTCNIPSRGVFNRYHIIEPNKEMKS